MNFVFPSRPAIRQFGSALVNGEWLREWIDRTPLPHGVRRALPAQRALGYSSWMERRFRWWDRAWLEQRTVRSVVSAIVPFGLYIFLAVVVAAMVR